MTRPGVVVALKLEVRPLTRKSMEIGELLQLPGGTLVRFSGIGAVAAQRAAEALLGKGATALVTWGTAGGLDHSLSPGSLLLPERVISTDSTTFLVDPAWHERLFNRLTAHVQLHTGPILQSAVIARSPSEKAALFKEYGAIAVDMESAAVAQAALDAEVPFAAIRAVTDPAQMKIPPTVIESIDEFGRFRPLHLLQSLVRHPGDFLLLVRLGRNFHAARRTLAGVIRLTGEQLLAP